MTIRLSVLVVLVGVAVELEAMVKVLEAEGQDIQKV